MTVTDQRTTPPATALTLAPAGLPRAPQGGPGAPVSSRARRPTSTDPRDFPVPSGREEEWRFTPLARLGGLLEGPAASALVAVEVAAPAGVEVGDGPGLGLLRPADRLAALALAGAEKALVIRVPRGSVLAEPVVVSIRTAPGVAYGHLVIDVQDAASATVVVDHTGSGARAALVELRVGDGAELRFIEVFEQERDATVVEAHEALVGRDARLRHVVVTLGGDLVRVTPTVHFAGPGGEAHLVGLFLTSAGQHHEHQLFVDHQAPQCRSRVTYKGALQGAGAHSVWVGDVHIGPEANGTDTYETNRNLVLTDGARADSVPNLEIETGDVTGAGHASATGRFDDEQLFYCMARGIPADEARRLVVRGFFAEVLAEVAEPTLRERLLVELDARLEHSGGPA